MINKNITIDNIIKIQPFLYSVYYTSNFQITELFYSISFDNGITWQLPINVPNFTNPFNINIVACTSFLIRLHDDVSFNIFTNEFNSTFT